jgi:hypothetical protein
MQPSNPHGLRRGSKGVLAILASPPGCLAQAEPTGGSVGSAGKAVGLDEGLHQPDWMAIAALPILGQTPGGQG